MLSANPLLIAPAACSRTPKCRLRPARLSGWKSPAPSKVRRDLLDGARSEEPPISHGTRCATMLSTFWLVSRPAAPFGIRWILGQVGIPVLGQLATLHLVELVGELRVFLAVRGKQLVPVRPQLGAALA